MPLTEISSLVSGLFVMVVLLCLTKVPPLSSEQLFRRLWHCLVMFIYGRAPQYCALTPQAYIPPALPAQVFLYMPNNAQGAIIVSGIITLFDIR